jgi:hypothetical protein
MRIVFVFLFLVTFMCGFSQNSEVSVVMVPTGEVVNEYDTIYNLEIFIEETTLQDSQSADLFISGLDSNYTVQAIDVLSPGNSDATPNGNRFRMSTENNRKKIVMQNATADLYTVRLILIRPDGQHVIEKKNH